jgi:hypothetical protein
MCEEGATHVEGATHERGAMHEEGVMRDKAATRDKGATREEVAMHEEGAVHKEGVTRHMTKTATCDKEVMQQGRRIDTPSECLHVGNSQKHTSKH